MRISRLTLVAIALIPVGLAFLLAAFVYFWLTYNSVMVSGTTFHVPSSVEIDLDNTREQAVWRELEGPHVSLNRPLLPPPDDLTITILDRRTGETIQQKELTWRVRQSLAPGFTRNRKAVTAFDPPEHGEIRVTIEGDFEHEQVYRVSPSIRNWAEDTYPIFTAVIAFAVICLIAGVTILIVKALRQERDSMEMLET